MPTYSTILTGLADPPMGFTEGVFIGMIIGVFVGLLFAALMTFPIIDKQFKEIDRINSKEG